MSDQLHIDTKCDHLIDVTNQKRENEGLPVPVPLEDGIVAFDAPVLGAAAPVAFAAAPPRAPVRNRIAAARPPPPPAAIVAESAFADYDSDYDEADSGEFSTTTSTITFTTTTTFAPEGFASSQKVSVTENKIDVRNYFPETWLFDMMDLDVEGKGSLELKAPHTITTWIADVFCSDADTGLEISNSTNLVVTQDFFADIK